MKRRAVLAPAGGLVRGAAGRRAGAGLGAIAVGAAVVGAAVAIHRGHGRTGRGIVIASRLYAPEPAAAALRLRSLARSLARRGEPVTVLTSVPPGDQAPTDPGVAVRSAPALRDDNGYIRGYAAYLSFDLPLAARLLAAPRPRLVVAEPPPTTGAVVRAVCVLRGLPYAYYAADVWSDAAGSTGAPGWVVGALRVVESAVVGGALRVLAVSQGVGERVTELGAHRVTVVPNGIDTETFTSTGPLAPAAPRAPYFLYAGTASEWQGAGVFIEALRLVHAERPDVELVYLGQGSDWEHLRELAGDDPRITLHGTVPAEQAAAWQRGAVGSVVSIRPGLGYDFAYPTKIFAALACGTPVVYAGPGPARADIPAAGLGRACDLDAAEVADAMRAVLADHEAARAAGPAALGAARDRLRAWVLAERSMGAATDRAAGVLLEDLG
ncbi:MAG: glycosyltransferase [Actinomyces sp.]|uniref:glycosyltransferase n=1 Tax=Actinomyces sp. TaxID=29317 RepID=UPI0026DA76E2|nr:glycosyltransferase [Actinomyces sp.]MDO4242216.1 glycosyltransferase [Actinomyces sp.]